MFSSRVEVPEVNSAVPVIWRFSALIQSTWRKSALIFSEIAQFRTENVGAVSEKLNSESTLSSADFIHSETDGF